MLTVQGCCHPGLLQHGQSPGGFSCQVSAFSQQWHGVVTRGGQAG